jgi:hypothetical protein
MKAEMEQTTIRASLHPATNLKNFVEDMPVRSVRRNGPVCGEACSAIREAICLRITIVSFGCRARERLSERDRRIGLSSGHGKSNI